MIDGDSRSLSRFAAYLGPTFLALTILPAAFTGNLPAMDHVAEAMATGAALLLFCSGYFLGRDRRVSSQSLVGVLVKVTVFSALIGAILAAAFVMSLYRIDVFAGRRLLLLMFLVAVGYSWLCLIVAVSTRYSKTGVVIASILLLPILVVGYDKMNSNPGSEHLVRTSLYDIGLRKISSGLPRSSATNSTLTLFPSGVLYIGGHGRSSFLIIDESGQISATSIDLDIPINTEDFIRDTGHRHANTGWFRIHDALLLRSEDRMTLLVSHHYWQAAENCYVIRISTTDINESELHDQAPPPSWETLYESKPCLELKDKGLVFAGLQAGLEMALIDESQLLVAIGDAEFDGVNSKELLPQEPHADYGKTLVLNLETRDVAPYTSGHRNPQGLVVDSQGRAWVSEHGPRGGDELNLLREGSNYGWPLATYGINYSASSWEWPLTTPQGAHTGPYVKPVYAWVPGIAPSTLLQVSAREFPLWKDDLLLTTLSGRNIYRLRLEANQVVLVESIRIQGRIRDAVELGDGRLLFVTEGQTLVLAENADTRETAEAALANCLGCHMFGDDGAGLAGPNLSKLDGRKIGSVAGFEYSRALRGKNGRWDSESLDAFLADPQAFAPGTSMVFPGIKNDTVRAGIVAQLLDE